MNPQERLDKLQAEYNKYVELEKQWTDYKANKDDYDRRMVVLRKEIYQLTKEINKRYYD